MTELKLKEYVIHGHLYYTVKDVYEAFEREEGSSNRRTWMDNLIREGRIPSYRFSKMRLIDQNGLSMVLAFRKAVLSGTRLRNGTVHDGFTVEDGRYAPEAIPDLYTAQEVMERDPTISLQRLAQIREQQPETAIVFGDAVTGYLPSVFTAVNELEDKPTGRSHKEELKPLAHERLVPLTEREKFVFRLRKQDLSYQQIAEQAVEDGVSAKVATKSYWQQVYRTATSKLRAYEARHGMGEDEVLALDNPREVRREEKKTQHDKEGMDT